MAKTLNCRDVGVDCDFQATGETNEEILAKTREHARTAHGFDDIPPELMDKVQAAIKES